MTSCLSSKRSKPTELTPLLHAKIDNFSLPVGAFLNTLTFNHLFNLFLVEHDANGDVPDSGGLKLGIVNLLAEVHTPEVGVQEIFQVVSEFQVNSSGQLHPCKNRGNQWINSMAGPLGVFGLVAIYEHLLFVMEHPFVPPPA